MWMRPVARVGVFVLFLLPLCRLPTAAAAPFADPAFEQQWRVAESAVPNFWGPTSTARDGQREAYREAPNGWRLVQYFDKARMERTDPATGTVTNGLLTVELISGKRQVGDAAFVSYRPSDTPIAGDPDNPFPTYKSLAALPAKVAQDPSPVARLFNPDGSFGADAALGNDPNVAFGSYQSDPGGQYGHNIPIVMWNYLQGLPVAWLTAMGYPITEAFWAQVKVGGVVKAVLVQAYQRRVLTYTPGNPMGFQVEMGNIGQHYFQWRYVVAPDGSSATGTSTAPSATTPSPTVTSPAATGTSASTTTVTFVSAPGAHPGSATLLTIKTTPGAVCTLDYQPPSATSPSRFGGAMTADKDGMVTWSFAAGGNEKHPEPKGKGIETVTCNGAAATNTITIG